MHIFNGLDYSLHILLNDACSETLRQLHIKVKANKILVIKYYQPLKTYFAIQFWTCSVDFYCSSMLVNTGMAKNKHVPSTIHLCGTYNFTTNNSYMIKTYFKLGKTKTTYSCASCHSLYNTFAHFFFIYIFCTNTRIHVYLLISNDIIIT